MPQVIKMPKMGNTVESVIVGEIKIKVGDTIKEEDVLFSYETDKSTTDYKSENSGKVQAILMEEGDEIEVLKPVIILAKDGEDISQYTVKKDQKEVIKTPEKQSVASQTNNLEPIARANTSNSQGSSLSSPRAKHLANKLNYDLSQINGNGAHGVICEDDVLTFHHSQKLDHNIQKLDHSPQENDLATSHHKDFSQPHSEMVKKPFTPLRMAIANNMTKSLTSMAQLTLGMEVDASELFKARKEIKSKVAQGKGSNSSINDIIIFALSRILVKHRHFNALVGQNYIEQFSNAHVCFAVDTKAGLFVPAVHNANQKTLSEITSETQKLIKKAHDGKLSANEMQGTFTITNLGLSGVSFFTPIINPPQAAILGIGSPVTRLRLNKNQEVEQYPAITLSLTMDHRPNDGASGTVFLKDIKDVLENIGPLVKLERYW